MYRRCALKARSCKSLDASLLERLVEHSGSEALPFSHVYTGELMAFRRSATTAKDAKYENGRITPPSQGAHSTVIAGED